MVSRWSMLNVYRDCNGMLTASTPSDVYTNGGPSSRSFCFMCFMCLWLTVCAPRQDPLRNNLTKYIYQNKLQ